MSVKKVSEESTGFSESLIDASAALRNILEHRLLTPVFQPIVDLRGGTLIGYEGLVRGPTDSPLHSPIDLFRVAARSGLTAQLEAQCGHCLLDRFAELSLPGRLFLNISPAALPTFASDAAAMKQFLRDKGLAPRQVVFELTEQPTQDPRTFYAHLAAYRASGIQLALDDLGDGHSSLRRWSDSRPDYVKVDMHFVRGVHLDPLKQQFLRSIRDIARESGALIVAEGIEQCEELEFLMSIDVRAGQGFYFARPEANPATELSPATRSILRQFHAKHQTLSLRQAQTMATRHANPLTQLPGNVPIHLWIDRLLADDSVFYACYADLDNFRPFNNTFGYIKGDDIIQLTGRLLDSFIRRDDFVGHLGGDDFLVLWRSHDWKDRCKALLKAFGLQMRAYLLDSGLMRDTSHQGYFAHERGGRGHYVTWPSLSLGVIEVHPPHCQDAYRIGAAAAAAKDRAKALHGNSLHVGTLMEPGCDVSRRLDA